jgi:hypothetical protein
MAALFVALIGASLGLAGLLMARRITRAALRAGAALAAMTLVGYVLPARPGAPRVARVPARRRRPHEARRVHVPRPQSPVPPRLGRGVIHWHIHCRRAPRHGAGRPSLGETIMVHVWLTDDLAAAYRP